ncbi:hypothetical protein BSP38_169 [Bacillus phage BSP38]|uniref:Uncharacterized protein n=1 Tax=Bacillus phage BSP38 TaxID=2283013 RepID=A0A345MK29_BPBSP|nr:hypothetical protein HWB82_gp149 [Bacillus phage BSP38]AXH71211.1 hypothetical protein BSP38_169 [Bacillus phage BSP38]
MSKKDKFIVWKVDELIPMCTEAELKILSRIVDRIVRKRVDEGKKPANSYIVISTDEPYADDVREILKKHGDWD